jgi:hypothetical protein
MNLLHFIYIFIILLSLVFIFPNVIEGNTCRRSVEVDDYGNTVKCTDTGVEPLGAYYKNKPVQCDERGPYI